MLALRWVWSFWMRLGKTDLPDDATPSPRMIFYTLRLAMFVYSVLGDAALRRLVADPSRQSQVLALYASSWSTLAMQTHTFSNSVETVLLLWCLVAVDRLIAYGKVRRGAVALSTVVFLTVR
jgi:phosphatidylinositol glycan class Z